ncbi:N-acetyltransferase domain-containing protein [Mycena indigotica]|uniref:N-acetyltransferase domain-containing protein n=1 Tax=Mycena indigotica TaxID=2126181 RepID=A0A8H6TGQ7_9AGAR|nr:N-acetyltransferase domain-containing protein [Mycena indigotica]KAF7315445.1 N-acetyltransferase domain-containing protein [Mycena indigotica]
MSSTKSAKPITFASLTPNNLGTVRKLNSVLFPIKYSEKFYEDVLKPDVEDFCKLVYYNDIPVGIVCCRLEPQDGEMSLYLATLGILAPYRDRLLGSETLQLILDACGAHTKPKIDRIYLHVQTSNTGAKKFYERHGFVQTALLEGYYKKIEPHDAWVLEKRLV